MYKSATWEFRIHTSLYSYQRRSSSGKKITLRVSLLRSPGSHERKCCFRFVTMRRSDPHSADSLNLKSTSLFVQRQKQSCILVSGVQDLSYVPR